MITSRRRSQAYKTFFNTEDGKIVLADILRFTGVDTDPYVLGNPDATMRNLGVQSVGRRLKSILKQKEEDIEKIAEQYKIDPYNPFSNKQE